LLALSADKALQQLRDIVGYGMAKAHVENHEFQEYAKQ
jgi:hypothetical protein